MSNTSTKTPKFIAMLLANGGATSEELRVAMNRVWGPTIYQLRPIAKRTGHTVRRITRKGEYTRYAFTPRKARATKVAA